METFELHPGQQYIFDTAETLGIHPKPELLYWPEATDTCREKAELLTSLWGKEWPDERVVKALYFQRDHRFVGIITPEIGAVPIKRIIKEAMGISGAQADKYRQNGQPLGMENGTCTPFPIETIVGSEIQRLAVYAHPTIDNQIVDISVGGSGEEAHKTSMHLHYGAILDILQHQFGDLVVKVNGGQ